MKQHLNLSVSKVIHSATFVLSVVLFLLIGSTAWASEEQEKSSEGLTTDSDACYAETFGTFAKDLGDEANESSSIRRKFFSALAWHECALQSNEPQRQSMLEMALSFYSSYLEARPNDAGAAYNMAKAYQQLGRIDEAVRYFDRAIATESDSQQVFLIDYAEFLDSYGKWQEASSVYIMLAQKYPLSDSQQEALAERFSERGLDELAGFLWALIDQGGSWQTVNIALEHLQKDENESAESQIEILTITAVALSRLNFDPVIYQDELRPRLVALSGKPAIASGVLEIIKLQDVAVHILTELGTSESFVGDVCKAEDQHLVLVPSEFPWWGTKVQGSTNRSPARGVWPADGFRALTLTLGTCMLQTANHLPASDTRSLEYFRFAESYFTLAAELREGEVDPTAVVELVGLKIESDQLLEVEEVREKYDDRIETENRNAKSEAQLKKAFSYHQAMGGLYSNLSDAGDTDSTEKAVEQLELALDRNLSLDTNHKPDAKDSEELPWNYQFTPDMVDMLTEGYEKMGESDEKIAGFRLKQAERYLEAGNPCVALDILAPLGGFDTLNSTTQNDYEELLGKLNGRCELGYLTSGGSGSGFNTEIETVVVDPPEPAGSNYIGDDIRLSIGYDSETDLTGEFLWNYFEDSDSAYSIEGWKGDDSSGGLKLNFHWLADGIQAGVDKKGNPIYSDGKVRKLFVAADQNVYSDGKVTFGGGSEHEDHFWSLYASKSTTGKRALGQTIDIQQLIEESFNDNHTVFQTDTWTKTTDFFARPYDWGVGFRVGRFYEDSLIRLRGGFDYEDGDFSSYQLTGYVSADKRFNNSRQGLSVRAEIVRKNGDFETDKNDLRFSAFWSWDFGQNFRSGNYSSVAQAGQIANTNQSPGSQPAEVLLTGDGQTGSNQIASDTPDQVNGAMVDRQVTMKGAGFKLDSASLTPDAEIALTEFIESTRNSSSKTRIVGGVSVVGHTCWLGDEGYNKVLSERRAETVASYLKNNGFAANILKIEGRGEMEPKYSNCSEDTRSKNRRVEIEYTSEEEVVSLDQFELAFATNMNGSQLANAVAVEQPAPIEAAWIRRALRNPVRHKRTVDYYRYNRVTEQHETEREVINTGPEANNDDYAVEQDSSSNPLNVLDNDSDPEYDNLKIIAVSNPAHGTATISGNTILYTPDPGFNGTDTFSYEIEDVFVTEPHPPGESSSAQVTIEVVPGNLPPDAMDDSYTIAKNTYDQPFNVLENDTDPDGDTIRIKDVGTPANGTVSFTGDLILYTPNPEFIGQDRFEYTITDDISGDASAWVTVDVVNQPPVAVDDWAEVWKNNRVTIDVLANDYDPDGDEIVIVAIIQDEHPMGTVIDNGDGTLTYYPMKGWFGGDKFQYTISDGDLTSTATVIIDVKGIPR